MKRFPSFLRVEKKRAGNPSRFIAYDLETTRIRAGTPAPRYVTAYGENPPFSLRQPIEDMDHLLDVLIERFLIPHFVGVKFVGWNANHFDAYFVAAALLRSDDYIIRPYLTRSKSLRGMRVIVAEDSLLHPKEQRAWEFLDGIAMTGLQGVSLADFLDKFAPDYRKLTGVINFEEEEFDATNPAHVEYAMRDSEGLYYAIRRAEDILLDHFQRPMAATIGNVCIKIFRAHIPEKIAIHDPGAEATAIIRNYVLRGGFCFHARSYTGAVWKFDINQAYASAMREARLPAGFCARSPERLNRSADVFIVRIRAKIQENLIPFYCKIPVTENKTQVMFATNEIPDSWITSIEYDQLLSEGWQIEILDSYYWDASFSMKDYVDKLEHIRRNCSGGPSGAIGTMIKAVGNHSYGKTVETLEPVELLLAKDCPDGFAEYLPEEKDKVFQHLWYAEKEPAPRDYHKPQIGAFITAHVRMVVRRAALLNASAWLYADTDCVVFDSPVEGLDIDPARYGAWKQEENGAQYRMIAKKVYAKVQFDPKDRKAARHAKGLNVRRLTPLDFERWQNGDIPEQTQNQRQNFLKVMQGSEMFIERKRKGTAIAKTA